MPKGPKRPDRRAPREKQSAAAQDTSVSGSAPEKPRGRRGPRPGSESARRGGLAVREKYGSEFFAKIGSKGGKSVSAQHGADFYAGIGHRGGSSTRNRLGLEHYERIGRMGGLRQRQREREAASQQTAEQTTDQS